MNVNTMNIYYSMDGASWEFYSSADRQDEITQLINQMQTQYHPLKTKLVPAINDH